MTDYFEITALSRDDIESIGYSAKNLTDQEMKAIAEKMGEMFCDSNYWEILEAILNEPSYYKVNKE
jgi:hypothetical protein